MDVLALSRRREGTTITRWLYDELRRAILEGRLPRGCPLPATRRLAVEYSISRRIVVNVFGRLEEEGYVTAHTGSGTRVSATLPDDFLSPAPRPRRLVRTSGPEDALYRRPVRPFRAIEPALNEFPTELWTRLTARCLRAAGTADLAGVDAAGHPELREAVSAYLGAARGVVCSPAQIVITSGAQQGLDLLARAALRPGDRVWMEDPGYPDAAAIFRLAGATVVPVPVDENGIVVERGLAACPRPKAVYLTPAHQFPTGVALSLDRRLELLRWARRHRVLIVEDDYDSEFRFRGRPVPAMKSLTGSEQVCLTGTFNKCLFPGLRAGYLVLPGEWCDPVVRLRRLVERHPPVLPQLVLAAFLSEGHFARHLRRMRQLYASRLAALRAAVERHLAGVLELPDIEAGLNTPAWLRNGMTSRQAAERAVARGLEVWAIDRFALARRDLRGLLLGFAAFTEAQIQKGVLELARALLDSGPSTKARSSR